MAASRRQITDGTDIAELRDQAQERTRAGDLTAADALVARAADYGDDEAPLTFGAWL